MVGPLDRLLIGLAAALATVLLLFLVGWAYTSIKRRRQAKAPPGDPYWSRFSHAYGDASDLPALFEQLDPDPKHPIWGELWSRLCTKAEREPPVALPPCLCSLILRRSSRQRRALPHWSSSAPSPPMPTEPPSQRTPAPASMPP